MAADFRKYPVLRHTFIVLMFLGLVGLFFFLNYLFFIPQQQQAYNEKIFRALHQITEEFKSTLEGKVAYIKNKNTNTPAIKLTRQQVNNIKFRTLLNTSFNQLSNIGYSQYIGTYHFKTDTVVVQIYDPALKGKGSKYAPQKDTIAIQELLEPNVQNTHKDLFDLVMLVKRDTGLVTTEKGKKMA